MTTSSEPHDLVVNQACIDDGSRDDPKRHPIALAMSTYPYHYSPDIQIKEGYFSDIRVGCGVRFTGVRCYGQRGILNEKGVDWAEKFSRGDPVEPVEVILYWPMVISVQNLWATWWSTKTEKNITRLKGIIDFSEHTEMVVREVMRPVVEDESDERDDAVDYTPLCVVLPSPESGKRGKLYRKWKNDVAEAQIVEKARDKLSPYMRRRMYTEELVMDLEALVKDRDADNVWKACQDTLEPAGVVFNDKMVRMGRFNVEEVRDGEVPMAMMVLRLKYPFSKGFVLDKSIEDMYRDRANTSLKLPF